MSDLRRRYDLTREAVRIAKLNTKKAEAALKKAKDEYDKTQKTQAMTERQFAKVSAEVDQALALATTINKAKGSSPNEPIVVEPVEPAETPAAEPARQTVAQLPRVSKSQRQLVEAFPLDGPTALRDLRQLLGLSDGGLNARIQKAKKAGLVEHVSWGQYQLTEAGRAIRSSRLHLVSSSEGA